MDNTDNKEAVPAGLRVMIFNNFVKTLRQQSPKACTFIAPYKDANGELTLMYKVGGQDYHLSIPENYDITIADRERIKNLIEETCQKVK